MYIVVNKCYSLLKVHACKIYRKFLAQCKDNVLPQSSVHKTQGIEDSMHLIVSNSSKVKNS